MIVDEVGVVVTRVYVGALMTSLEMAGVSLTLLKMKPEWIHCLGMCKQGLFWIRELKHLGYAL